MKCARNLCVRIGVQGNKIVWLPGLVTGYTQNPGGISPSNEVVENLVDDTFDTKWLDFVIQTVGSSTVIFRLNTSQ